VAVATEELQAPVDEVNRLVRGDQFGHGRHSRVVIAVDVVLDAVVDRGLFQQRLGFEPRELKSVVLELDQRPAERFSMLGVADRSW
jgi:hypothetical protein